MTMDECNGKLQDSRSLQLQSVIGRIRRNLDLADKARFETANRTWQTFVKADGEAVFDDFRGGTAAPVMEGTSNIENTETRAKRLREFDGYHPGAAKGFDAELNAAYQKLGKNADAQHRTLIAAAERAWILYRDAELAFYAHHFAGALWPSGG